MRNEAVSFKNGKYQAHTSVLAVASIRIGTTTERQPELLAGLTLTSSSSESAPSVYCGFSSQHIVSLQIMFKMIAAINIGKPRCVSVSKSLSLSKLEESKGTYTTVFLNLPNPMVLDP